MDGLSKMNRDELVRRMREDFERTMLQVTDAEAGKRHEKAVVRRKKFKRIVNSCGSLQIISLIATGRLLFLVSVAR